MSHPKRQNLERVAAVQRFTARLRLAFLSLDPKVSFLKKNRRPCIRGGGLGAEGTKFRYSSLPVDLGAHTEASYGGIVKAVLWSD